MPKEEATSDAQPVSPLRHPNTIIAAVVAAIVAAAALRPDAVPEDRIPNLDLPAESATARPSYGFDPGPSFFARGSAEDLPIAALPPSAGDFAHLRTYREDTGPGFFDLIAGDRAESADEAPLDADIFTRLFDAPLTVLERSTTSLNVPQDGLLRLRVEDFGAIADPGIDNRQAIQDAIDYAHAVGGGVIHLGEGVYGVSGDPRGQGAIKLRSNTFLQGAGMGKTVLRLADGWAGRLVGLVRTQQGRGTRNYGLADLTLDGNRTGTSGDVDAFNSGGSADGGQTDADAWILRVEARDFSGSGFDPHEGTRRLTVAGSVARNNGRDGFVAGGITDGVFRRNVAVGNGRHGFNVLTSSAGFVLEENVAQSNGGAGLVVDGGDGGDAQRNLRILRMQLTDNGREGVLVRQARDVELAGIVSARNGTYGARIEGSRNVVLRDSIVMDNSVSERGGFAAVQIRARATDEAGPAHPSRDVVVRDSVIGWQVPLEQRAAVQELKGDVAGTVISGNRFRGNFRRPVEIGARDTLARNHPIGLAWLETAARGLVAGPAAPSETVDCTDAATAPEGCAAPDLTAVWPKELDRTQP
jgi:hypothetical protein